MGLREMRKLSGLSQRQLADLSGVNLRSLQDYEQGHKSLSSAKGETLLRLSSVLDFTINDILSGECSNLEIESNELRAYRSKRRLIQYQSALEKKNSRLYFPVIASDKSVDMSCIYPTKQKLVKKVLSDMRRDSRVTGLWLFGSSITIKCHKNSDIDFAVGLKDPTIENKNEISEIIQNDCDYGADILWMDRLSEDDRVYGDIMKGLVLI